MASTPVTIEWDSQKLNAALWRLSSRQLPFAMSLGLNRVAKRTQVAERSAMSRVFDRPTPFTLNALRIEAAKKDRLQARVWFRDWAAKGTPAERYLMPQVIGGARRDKRFEMRLKHAGLLPKGMQLVPGSAAPLDAYGNVQRRVYTQILSQLQAQGDAAQNENRSSRRRSKTAGRYFWGNPGGRGLGVWQRIKFGFGTAVRPVFRAVPINRYKPRFAFFDIAEREAAAAYEPELVAAIEQAIRTARG